MEFTETKLDGKVALLGEQLADWLRSKSYSKWGSIRLVASHQWGSLGLNFRASALYWFLSWFWLG